LIGHTGELVAPLFFTSGYTTVLKKFLWLFPVLTTIFSTAPPARAALSFIDQPLFGQAAPPPMQATTPTSLNFADPYEPTPVEPDVNDIRVQDPVPQAGADSSGDIFSGGQNSLVAVAVGSAEGTRRPDGGFNDAYVGHSDPGNQVWNLGSFSYQHGADSPEHADEKQLARLRGQDATLTQIAASYSMTLDLEERMNGIDLANQAPQAALDRGGYIDWLADAKQKGLTGAAGILYARTNSFINPRTGNLNAPGLGNSWSRVEADQKRRMEEIWKAIQKK